MIQIEFNEDNTICALCNGACCKSHPCAVFPQDVIPFTKEHILEMVNNKYTINWWEGDVIPNGNLYQVYYLMPRTKSENTSYCGSWGGECIFFKNNKGCELEWNNRPTGGKSLIPNKEFKCKHTINPSDKKAACIEWRNHQLLLKEVIDCL